MIKFKEMIIALLIIILISILILNHKNLLKLVYPIYYEDIIVEEAKKNDLDPYLIISVIYVESKFRTKATSPKGARGLMQVMPKTGKWISTVFGYKDFSPEDLYEPKINISFGSWYLKELIGRFDNLYTVLAAYNGGEGNVKRWLEEGVWDGSYENVEDIPFGETRDYVARVIRTLLRYKYIYE
ncbi:lytic transglycosylase domain-containing protein [Halonatronum saccharophilum]|uniref:lytic transglycosylase domain-containing protein n=1 Tax=Halonatronum saccharophilum TaxID=150060 RepID=UPI001FE0CE37|nr:lytic transglycosylase domain-containing protein [Halonatronum saccharophilum]